ncbi:uncharacterized protein LOC129599148 [Paramacrobiotus metropolitanus]|uniref:uncharacterized protein LOC129599148 n=1 Tax=Paramacrobiotus metropolitanus TaxID=2943436 RepID=UPI002445F19F|nr:uncharacterized protein LOC129599148 [Paramacrobiotus metropolitanus]
MAARSRKSSSSSEFDLIEDGDERIIRTRPVSECDSTVTTASMKQEASDNSWKENSEVPQATDGATGFANDNMKIDTSVTPTMTLLADQMAENSIRLSTQTLVELDSKVEGAYATESDQELMNALLSRSVWVLEGISKETMSDIKKAANACILTTSDKARTDYPEKFATAKGIFLEMLDTRAKVGDSNEWLFVYVDPSLKRKANETDSEQTTLQYFRYGQLECGDILAQIVDGDQEDIPSPTAKALVVPVRSEKPKKCGLAELPCPGSKPFACCPMTKRFEWKCTSCEQILEYGFDGHFYCTCGKTPVEAFVFRCGLRKHGWEYTGFEQNDLTWVLKEVQPYKELNILVLGETGVGKSTWINGFANFLTYSALNEALADPIYLIPTRFTTMDKDFEQKVVSMGSSDNENDVIGQSATQLPKSYAIRRGGMIVRLIDTPGIGDTRGTEQDKRNFQFIMQHLSNFENIHGICILLKPNNSRLTVMFRFCIKELLSHLHRDACHNIVFVFTNARSTFYRPGDTFPILQKLIKESQGVDIPLNQSTVYSVDSEAVRFMAALKSGIQFDETETQNFFKSWEKSVEETERLLQHVSTRKPHALQNTLSLNEARRMILSFTEPLAQITKNIQLNLKLADEKAEEIREAQYTKAQLSQQLYVPVIDLVTKPLGYPRTVCASRSCIRVVGKKVDYITRCHEHCLLQGIQQEQYPNPGLQKCQAMMKSGGLSCERCRCSWDKHMHISYEMQEVLVNEMDQRVQKLLHQKDGELNAVGIFLKELNQRKQDLAYEEKEIRKVAAKFGCFLKKNAMIPYNDAMEEYLHYLIGAEKEKIALGCGRDGLEGYERMLQGYREEKQLLEESMQGSDKDHPITANNIMGAIQSLYNLPINGKKIQNFVEMIQGVRKQQVRSQETLYAPKYGRHVRYTQYKAMQEFHDYRHDYQSNNPWREAPPYRNRQPPSYSAPHHTDTYYPYGYGGPQEQYPPPQPPTGPAQRRPPSPDGRIGWPTRLWTAVGNFVKGHPPH